MERDARAKSFMQEDCGQVVSFLLADIYYLGGSYIYILSIIKDSLSGRVTSLLFKMSFFIILINN